MNDAHDDAIPFTLTGEDRRLVEVIRDALRETRGALNATGKPPMRQLADSGRPCFA